MGMQTQFGAVRTDAAFGTHHKSFAATVAKLVLALNASEMHTTTFRQGISELALRAVYTVFG